MATSNSQPKHGKDVLPLPVDMVIDSEELRREVVDILMGTVLRDQFKTRWTEVAFRLCSKSDIEKIRVDLVLDKIQPIDALHNLLEIWVGKEGRGATLTILVESFRRCQLEQCAEALENWSRQLAPKDFTVSYVRLPSELEEFLKAKEAKHICIVQTIDVDITSAKIRQYDGTCQVCDREEILDMISKPTQHDRDKLYVVIDKDTNSNLAMDLSSLVIEKGTPDLPKVVVVTNKSIENVQELVGSGRVANEPEIVRSKSSDNVIDLLRKTSITKQNIIQICKDNMRWDDLSSQCKNQIIPRIVGILHMYKVECTFEFEKFLNGEVLVMFMNCKDAIQLFRRSVPGQLPSYMYLSLLARNIISEKIFQLDKIDHPDIFLISGIDMHNLGSKVSKHLTDTAANQMELLRITKRFISFDREHPEHFPEICKRTQNPVHLLFYQEDKLIWQKSRGSIRTIQDNLDNEISINEKMFFDDLPLESNLPICISGCCGTGKSMFLARAGQILSGTSNPEENYWVAQTNYRKRIVVFAKPNEFVRGVKQAESNTVRPTKRAILKALGKLICRNELEYFILKYIFRREDVALELMLDGFDEVDSLYLNFAHQVVKKITRFRFIRLWLTTRMIMLEELEHNLGVLSYSLNSFCDKHLQPDKNCKDVVTYLKLCCKELYLELRTSDETTDNRLDSLAQSCISSYVSQSESYDEEYMANRGIIFTYFLLAKLYAHHALDAKTDKLIMKPVKVFPNLFHSVIKNRIKAYQPGRGTTRKYDSRTLKDMHLVMGMKCLFPSSIIETSVAKATIEWDPPMDDIYKVGLIQPPSHTCPFPCFQHRSFSEYFIVWFLIGELKKGCPSMPAKTRKGNTWQLTQFSRSHVCYFIELRLLGNQLIHPCYLIYFSEFDQAKIMKRVAEACAERNFINIFKLLLEVKAFRKHKEMIFSKGLVKLSIRRSCLEFVQLVFEHYEKYNRLVYGLQMKSLRLAVEIGEYAIVEFLIKKKGLWKVLQTLDNDSKLLIHSCVKNTNDEDRDRGEIGDRKNILYLLAKANPLLLSMKDELDRIPCQSGNIDMELEAALKQAKLNFPRRELVIIAPPTLTVYVVGIIITLIVSWLYEHGSQI